MRKNFVLDTNVLLHDPGAIEAFEENIVNIPIHVIEEIDQFKKELSELGRNARHLARTIDEYRLTGTLREGVELPNGGLLRVLFSAKEIPPDLRAVHSMDNLILAVAIQLRDEEPDRETVFVSMDTNLRIRADAMGIIAQDFRREKVELSELYTGASEYSVPTADFDRFFEDNELPLPDEHDFHPNEYLTLGDAGASRRTALARVNAQKGLIQPIFQPRGGVSGIQPRNREQRFALDVLLREDVRLVTLLGKAGTGKTLLALAAGIYQTIEEQTYLRLLVSRPIYPLGRDIGYLPGGVEDKLNPWMQPIHDNMELLANVSTANSGTGEGYHDLLEAGLVQVEPLTYIRGRSIPNQFIVVDEAQNLTPHEVKTIITRVGHGTKIVFTGDPYQIDNPYVDSSNNGLTYLTDRFQHEAIAGSVTLFKGERSQLAELAANLL